MNFKFIATQFGESVKWDTSLNKIDRVFNALSEIKLVDHPNEAITSERSKLIYSWIMTIGDSSLLQNEKIRLIQQAVIALTESDLGARKKILLLINNYATNTGIIPLKSTGKTYIHLARIDELRSINSNDFDLSRLIKYCEEINIAFAGNAYLLVGMGVRAILDHIPPIFGQIDFTNVISQHGSQSFKSSMTILNNSLRKISDSYLHTQIRNKESLPNSNQIDFTNDLDVLLSEVYRILKK